MIGERSVRLHHFVKQYDIEVAPDTPRRVVRGILRWLH